MASIQKPAIVRRIRKWFSAFTIERHVTKEVRDNVRDVKRDYDVFLKHGLTALDHVSKALDAAGVEWWLSYGALLGWRRQNALIPHDLDFVLAPGTDKEAVRHALASVGFLLVDRLRYWGQVTNENYWGNNTFIDLFYLIKRGQESFVFAKWDECCILLTEPPLTRVKAKFQDVDIWVPQDVERYLESLYGSDWQIPKDDWNWLLQPNLHSIRGNPVQRARCLRELRKLQSKTSIGS